jgi:predicted alpha/beta-hydrolase family hydrolase
MIVSVEPFSTTTLDPPVRGFLHRPASPSGDGLVLTHGAGGNAKMALLVALAEAFAGAGFTVLRCDLPFRQTRSFGPPRPGDAARDRDGLRNAVAAMKKLAAGRVFLGGQSYGGRQASMLLADIEQKQVPRLEGRFASESSPLSRNDNSEGRDELADGLLLLSYPLHAPAKPDQPRIQHLPKLNVPTLFVSGTRDPFGSIEEIESARKLISAKADLLVVEGAGHDLGFKGKAKQAELPLAILREFVEFFV